MTTLTRAFVWLGGSLVLAALWVVVPASVAAGDPCYHGYEMPAHSVSTAPEINALPCAFAPTVTYVPTGTTVTFSNGSQDAHLITGANQEWGSRDEELEGHASVSYTFDRPGVYPYACALHRGMVGAIVVGADAAGALAPGTGAGAAPPAVTDAAPSADPAPAGAPAPAAVAVAVVVGALIALALVTLVRSARRPVVVKEIG